MTDLISRQDAIALLEGIPDDTDGNGYEAGYNQAKRDCIEALTNMPSADTDAAKEYLGRRILAEFQKP